MKGTLRSRLLVNAVVDPDEVAPRLPKGLRPRVSSEGTVVGCCLLEIEHLRPSFFPERAGRGLRAAAHRIAVEWEDDEGETTGVYVPMRHTQSRLAVALGGRWFPGVHTSARIEMAAGDDVLRWSVSTDSTPDPYQVQVTASTKTSSEESAEHGLIGRTCIDAAIGLSPGRRGRLEGACMQPEHRKACEVAIEHLDSAFIAGFDSARPAPSYLMRNVAVTWTPATAPGRPVGAVQ